MRHTGDTCHVSLLELYKSTSIPLRGVPAPPPPLNLKDGQEHFEIEAILDSLGVRNRLQYFIKWKEHPNSWEPLSSRPICGLVNEFHRRIAVKPGSSCPQIHYVTFVDTAGPVLWDLIFPSVSRFLGFVCFL